MYNYTMNQLQKIWNNFKAQPDVWFFYGFLATFTLSVRKVLFFYPINEQFNEYTSIYLYISDLFLLSIAISWLVSILRNKQFLLSIIKAATVPPREKCSTWNNFRGRHGTLLLPLFLVAWSFISINWSVNQDIALFRSIKLFEYYILFLYLIIKIVPRTSRQMFHVEHSSNIISPKCSTWNNTSTTNHSDWDGTILRNTFKIIISISLIQAIIGIWQFIAQHSIGLFWLKESLISPEIAGVAKIILNQEKIIRAYGLFPHPNILAGFLLFSIIITIAYRKMFHVEQFQGQAWNILTGMEQKSDSKLAIKCSTWNNSQCETYKPTKNVPRGTIIDVIQRIISDRAFSIILVIQIVATILTFSKSAILGLIIAIGYAYWTSIKAYAVKLFHVEQFSQKSISPEQSIKCSTWDNDHCEAYNKNTKSNNNMFHVEHFGRKSIILLGIFVTLVVIIKPDINSLLFKSLNERMLYLNVSRGTISDNYIFGIGSGQFVADMHNHTNQALSDWQFQPVHNVFLLVWSELGLIGLALLIWMLWKMFHVEQFERKIVTPELSIKCSTPASRRRVVVSASRGGWNNSHCETYKPAENVPRGTFSPIVIKLFKGLIIGFIFIMLFDHYLWDIQQGQMMLWMALAFLVSI